jgi:hypothetical protein
MLCQPSPSNGAGGFASASAGNDSWLGVVGAADMFVAGGDVELGWETGTRDVSSVWHPARQITASIIGKRAKVVFIAPGKAIGWSCPFFVEDLI